MLEQDWISRLPQAVSEHVRGLSLRPDFARNLASYSDTRLFSRPKHRAIGHELAERAWRLAPHDPVVRQRIQWFIRPRVLRWHFEIVNDAARNEIYRQALTRYVRPGMIVFEVGTGTGVLAMFAAQAGAEHVYTCEQEPLLAEAARENIARNGLTGKITVIAKRSDAVQIGGDLPRRADLFVSELIDNSLLGEHVLAITRDVQARLLVPDAIILPDRIELRGTLVGGPEWTKEFRAQPVSGLDVSALDQFGPSVVPVLDAPEPHLAEGVTVFGFDLAEAASYLPEQKTLAVAAKEHGVADGFLHWIWLRFGAGLEYDNRPPTKSCWAPQIHAFPQAIAVAPGQKVSLHVQHDEGSVGIWPTAVQAAPIG
jgi:arginine Nomega-methyltransferase